MSNINLIIRPVADGASVNDEPTNWAVDNYGGVVNGFVPGGDIPSIPDHIWESLPDSFKQWLKNADMGLTEKEAKFISRYWATRTDWRASINYEIASALAVEENIFKTTIEEIQNRYLGCLYHAPREILNEENPFFPASFSGFIPFDEFHSWLEGLVLVAGYNDCYYLFSRNRGIAEAVRTSLESTIRFMQSIDNNSNQSRK